MMTSKELVKKSPKELQKTVAQLRTKIATIKREQVQKQPTNNQEIKTLKRDVARTLTILNQKAVDSTSAVKEAAK